MPWTPAYAPTFKRDYKNLSQENQQRVDEAIVEIVNVVDPARVGRPKYGKWKGMYGYDIGRAIRILYSVESEDNLVIFLRCGSHSIY